MSAELRGDQPRLADATQHHDGETIPADGAPSLRIQASDIYEWVAGRAQSLKRSLRPWSMKAVSTGLAPPPAK
jgi:hypothetical protein